MAEAEGRPSRLNDRNEVGDSKALFWSSWSDRWLWSSPTARLEAAGSSGAGWEQAERPAGSGSAASRAGLPRVPLENECFITMFCTLHFQSARQTIANYNPYERIICLAACGKAFYVIAQGF